MLSLLDRQVPNVQNNLSNVIRNICALCLASSTYGIGVGFKNLKDMQLIFKEPYGLKNHVCKEIESIAFEINRGVWEGFGLCFLSLLCIFYMLSWLVI